MALLRLNVGPEAELILLSQLQLHVSSSTSSSIVNRTEHVYSPRERHRKPTSTVVWRCRCPYSRVRPCGRPDDSPRIDSEACCAASACLLLALRCSSMVLPVAIQDVEVFNDAVTVSLTRRCPKLSARPTSLPSLGHPKSVPMGRNLDQVRL